MEDSQMPNAYISGTGMYVPPRVVTNDDLVKQYNIDTNNEWIIQRTGIEERRFADAGVGASDLAVPACEEAIKKAGIDKTELDMIVLASLSPDCHFPGTGVYLQDKLGLTKAEKFIPAMDIRNQCSGFVYGLATASAIVQSGGAKHVLLVGVELHSHALDLSTRGRAVASLFGDGAGAVVVSATPEDRGVRGWYLGADGRYADCLCQKIWDISADPYIPVKDGYGHMDPSMLWANMDGKTVFKHAVTRMPEVLNHACSQLNINLDDIDLFYFHQANLRINQYIEQQMGIPEEKTVNNIQRFGNTTAATIPMMLAETEKDGRLKPGKKIAMIAFGSGFTWGCVIMDW